ncbi:MAG: hypothetical protein ABH956_00820 [Candidatus Nealsonbacteria bacterium]
MNTLIKLIFGTIIIFFIIANVDKYYFQEQPVQKKQYWYSPQKEEKGLFQFLKEVHQSAGKNFFQ